MISMSGRLEEGLRDEASAKEVEEDLLICIPCTVIVPTTTMALHTGTTIYTTSLTTSTVHPHTT